MNLKDFARTLLLGTTLEEKLVSLNPGNDPEKDPEELSAPFAIPRFPGRPLHLSKPGKATFPSLQQLHKPTTRGEVLHFFANHELLAMELMALMLLRFPEAPLSFRNGLAHIIQEEQSHLKLYLDRMTELGVAFGDLPVSDYFWNTMKSVATPLDFVVQMSLTFEQANLDFSLFFMKAIEREGDTKTAAILERVFREEIGHVKHGVVWFNRWRENPSQESDWDAYLRLLPSPISAGRAKGFEFSADARRQAGLSELFISELKLYTGSKGRPPVIWIYNPHCDAEIVRNRPGYTPSQGARRLTEDLEHLPLFLALDKDTVVVQKKPRSEWIETLQHAGFSTPEFAERKNLPMAQCLRAPKIGGLQPWGWSPDTFKAFQPLQDRLVNISAGNAGWCRKILAYENYDKTGLGKLFSKKWATQEWPLPFGGAALHTLSEVKERVSEIVAEGYPVMLKAPWGTSGMQVKSVRSLEEIQGPILGWIQNTLTEQGALIVEHKLNKLFDFSVQIEIDATHVKVFEVRRFITGSRYEYKGTYLGPKLVGLSTQERQFMHSLLKPWYAFVREIGTQLRQEGYLGPAGIDALFWKDKDGNLQWKPLVEINPRWTMGRVALELEKRLAPAVNGLWQFVTLKEIKKLGFGSIPAYAEHLKKTHPLILVEAGGGSRIQSGIVFTNDPATAQEVLTVLKV